MSYPNDLLNGLTANQAQNCIIPWQTTGFQQIQRMSNPLFSIEKAQNGFIVNYQLKTYVFPNVETLNQFIQNELGK